MLFGYNPDNYRRSSVLSEFDRFSVPPTERSIAYSRSAADTHSFEKRAACNAAKKGIPHKTKLEILKLI